MFFIYCFTAHCVDNQIINNVKQTINEAIEEDTAVQGKNNYLLIFLILAYTACCS